MPNYLIVRVYDDSQAFNAISTRLRNDGRSYKEIAEIAGLSPSTVSNWTFGTVQYPRLSTVFKFCKLYNLSFRIMPDNPYKQRRAA